MSRGNRGAGRSGRATVEAVATAIAKALRKTLKNSRRRLTGRQGIVVILSARTFTRLGPSSNPLVRATQAVRATLLGHLLRLFPQRQAGLLMAKFKDGHKDYNLGAHPLWEICRVTYQMTKRPFVIGGCVLLAGYLWCVVRGVKRPVSKELVAFRRQDQMRRLKRMAGRWVGRRAPAEPSAEASSGN